MLYNSSLVPRLSRGRRKRAWYRPFAHAFNLFKLLSFMTSKANVLLWPYATMRKDPGTPTIPDAIKIALAYMYS